MDSRRNARYVPRVSIDFLNYRSLPCDHKLRLWKGPMVALTIRTRQSDETSTTILNDKLDQSVVMAATSRKQRKQYCLSRWYRSNRH